MALFQWGKTYGICNPCRFAEAQYWKPNPGTNEETHKPNNITEEQSWKADPGTNEETHKPVNILEEENRALEPHWRNTINKYYIKKVKKNIKILGKRILTGKVKTLRVFVSKICLKMPLRLVVIFWLSNLSSGLAYLIHS